MLKRTPPPGPLAGRAALRCSALQCLAQALAAHPVSSALCDSPACPVLSLAVCRLAWALVKNLVPATRCILLWSLLLEQHLAQSLGWREAGCCLLPVQAVPLCKDLIEHRGVIGPQLLLLAVRTDCHMPPLQYMPQTWVCMPLKVLHAAGS